MKRSQAPTPEEFGMVAVTKDEFFATIGKLDIHPHHEPHVRYDQHFGYVSHWKLRDGRRLGVSWGGTTSLESQYAVTPAYAAKAKETQS